MTRKPDPLPDATAVFILPDGRPSPDFFRWLRDADRAVKATIDFIDTPIPDPQIEFPEQWPFGVEAPDDGDYVIIERRETARNGERVVALLHSGETTLKTFYKEGDKIRLQPANPEFKPIIVKDCKIQGVVTGVLRRY